MNSSTKTYSFPIATHSYFHVLNQSTEKKLFLESETYVPKFRYNKQLNEQLIEDRLARTEGDVYAQYALKLVYAGARMQGHQVGMPELISFRALNVRLFGAPQKSYIDAILHRASLSVTDETKPYWDYVTKRLGQSFVDVPDIGPSHQVFMKYKTYFDAYCHDSLYDVGRPLPELLAAALDSTGLADAGWTVRVVNGSSHARVHHDLKTVMVGQSYRPRTSKAAARIVAHEVYGHALRGHQGSVAEAEGFALVLEQLLDKRYKYRRSYRYLAAGLGMGTEDHPMAFREIFEIMWRIMVIMSRYSPSVAKRHAFDECTRVFRGGRPDVAGAVYLKDSVYFTANIDIWKQLSMHDLSYNDFIDLIEGRRKVLV